MVIVGAGECGASAALALREQGYAGPVTLIGAEPHPPYERPPLSKDAMADEAEPMPKHAASPQRLTEAGVTHLAATEVRVIDRQAKTVATADGASLGYDRLLIATGSSPRRLPLAEGSRRCVTLRTFDDALAIRAHLRAGVRVLIVGGGFIGLELAASARKLGCPVTVIEAQPRILMRGVPAEIAETIHAAHGSAGVHVLCGKGIVAVEDITGGVRIRLADGHAVEGDLCVIGIGAVPNVALAAAAGLAIDNGVAVDGNLRTGDPDIFAAGDCCSFPLALYGGRRVRLEAWRNAQEQGALAAKNMLGAGEAHDAVPWFWSDQYDLGLQIAGLPDEGVETVCRDLGADAFILFHLAADGRLVAASGIGPGNAVARDIRLAEMLIARRAAPSPEKLSAADTKLKSLLAA
ncbi:FAD-dependent oxidoreductase [Mesorhizobium sp. LHD-90]|uniref:NAD(P)/FAD-dependent oxidoreductase n=1 Tax=Mesorhizobium sp. LHD-90 TaxID=3071414 RepID=UPI0027DF0C51|nr:FAD-dependent oxidoreductase [Mesorhizobium sp. LHD-90]MDQ6435617.1 FAD-dependent oxidoreductase [Mesorhizobium sp. LHD-90]